MRRFLLNTSSFALAILLALGLADVIGVVPEIRPAILCPDGGAAVWGAVRHALVDEDLPNLSCRDAEGKLHGPNLNWSNGRLLGVSFWNHGERAGSTVAFYEDGRVWSVQDETADHPHMVTWAESGLKEYEEVQHRDVQRWSIWYSNGNLKAEGAWAGKSDPYWLPDGSFNEDREDSSYLVGEYRSYHENGSPKDVGFYREGARDGDWTCSDESGEHVVVATYENGKLASRTGSVDVATMKDRCQEHRPCNRSPGSPKGEPVAGGDRESAKCSTTLG